MRKVAKKIFAGLMAIMFILTVITPVTALAKTEYKVSKRVYYGAVYDENYRPSGKVEKSGVYTYTYNKNGDTLTDKSEYYKDGKKTETNLSTYSYDKNGKCTKCVTKQNKKVVQTVTYKYSKNKTVAKYVDAKKKLLQTDTVTYKNKKITSYVSKNAKGKVTYKATFKNGNMTKAESFRDDGTKKYEVKYNSHEDPISSKSYNEDGKTVSLESETKYTYKKNKKTKREELITYRDSYDYDGETINVENKSKVVTTYYTDGFKAYNIKEFKAYRYDKDEQKWVDSYTETFKYTADKSKKNVAKCECYMDGVLYSRTTYEYKKVNVK